MRLGSCPQDCKVLLEGPHPFPPHMELEWGHLVIKGGFFGVPRRLARHVELLMSVPSASSDDSKAATIVDKG